MNPAFGDAYKLQSHGQHAAMDIFSCREQGGQMAP